MRRVVATISYEVQFNLNLVLFILYHKRIILKDIGLVVNITFFLTFMISLLVELRRTPFDYVERERDLVRGFNTEYRRVSFVLLFLKEYGSLLFFSLLTSVLFFGGYVCCIMYMVLRDNTSINTNVMLRDVTSTRVLHLWSDIIQCNCSLPPL